MGNEGSHLSCARSDRTPSISSKSHQQHERKAR